MFDLSTEPPRRPLQWKLSTIMLLTVVAAIASAGFAKLGVGGALATLFAAWIFFIGAFCLYDGVRRRTAGWSTFALFGLVLLAIGLTAYLGIVLRAGEPNAMVLPPRTHQSAPVVTGSGGTRITP